MIAFIASPTGGPRAASEQRAAVGTQRGTGLPGPPPPPPSPPSPSLAAAGAGDGDSQRPLTRASWAVNSRGINTAINEGGHTAAIN